MAFILPFLAFLFAIFNFSIQHDHELNTTKNDSLNLITPDRFINFDGWHKITKQWPTESKLDHYFFDDQYLLADTDWQISTVKFREIFVEDLEQNFLSDENMVIDISFEIWIFSKQIQTRQTTENNILLTGSTGEPELNLYERYYPHFQNKWMPVLVRINRKDLSRFKVSFVSGMFFVAIRRFSVKYPEISKISKLAKHQFETKIDRFGKICFPPGDIQNLSNWIYYPICEQNKICSFSFDNYDDQNEFNNSSSTYEIHLNIWSQVNISSLLQFETGCASFSHNEANWFQVTVKNVTRKFLDFYFDFKENAPHCHSLAIEIESISSFCDNATECRQLVSRSNQSDQFTLLETIVLDNSKYRQFYSISTDENTKEKKFLLDSKLFRNRSIYSLCLDVDTVMLGDSVQSIQMSIFYVLGVESPRSSSKTSSNFEQVITTISIRPDLFTKVDLKQSNICLGDYVHFESKNYSIGLQFLYGNRSNGSILFQYNVTESNVKSKELNYVRSTIETDLSAYNHWSLDWNNRFEFFEDYFDFEKNHIKFDVEIPCTSQSTEQQVRLSTHWIRYRAGLLEHLPLYGIKFGSQSWFQIAEIYGRVCNQLGQCSVVSEELVNFDTADGFTVRKFNFTAIPMDSFQLFRLEFVFRFGLSCSGELLNNQNQSMLINAKLKLLYFGDPCLVPDYGHQVISPSDRCLNGGLCQSSVSSNNRSHSDHSLIHSSCRCQFGYYGDRCQLESHCQNHKGDHVCSQLGLKCQDTLTNFKCACEQSNMIFWNGTSCVAKQPTLVHVNQRNRDQWEFPLSVNVSQLDKPTYLLYQFSQNKDVPPTGLDELCLTVQYSLQYQNPQSLLQYRPTMFFYLQFDPSLKPNKQSKTKSLLLFRYMMEATTSDQYKNVSFCLAQFFPAKLLQEIDEFTVRIDVDSFVPSWSSVNENKVNRLSVHFEKSAGEIVLRSILFDVDQREREDTQYLQDRTVYNRWFDRLVQFRHWSIITTNQVDKDIEYLVIQKDSNDSKQWLTTLVSGWFRYTSNIDYVQIPINSSDLCTTTVRSAWVWYSKQWNSSIVKYELSSETDANSAIRYIGFHRVELDGGQWFRMAVEVLSNCSTVRLQQVLIETDPCKEMDCQNEGHCHLDRYNGTAQCQCTSEYFGQHCQYKNPCTRYENYCSKFANSLLDMNSAVSHCEPLTNNSFRCKCWSQLFQWNSGTMSCDPVYSNEMKERIFADNGIDNYLQNANSNKSGFSWMNRDYYWPIRQSIGNSVYYFALQNGLSNLWLDLSEIVTDQQDYCFGIVANVSGVNSWLGIGVNHQEPLLTNENDNDNDSDNSDELCVRSLLAPETTLKSKEYQSSMVVKFVADNRDWKNKNHHKWIGFRFINNQVTIKPWKEPNLRYLSATNSTKSVEIDWPLRYPASLWSSTVDGKICFEKKSNNENDIDSFEQVSYVFSVWLHSEYQLRLVTHRFVYEVMADDPYIELSPLVFNWRMENITDLVNITLKKNSQSSRNKTDSTALMVAEFNFANIQNQSLPVYWYRVGFQLRHMSHHKTSLTIGSIQVDDFCDPLDDTKLCFNRGQCLVDLSRSNGHRCHCLDGFIGDECQDIDYCVYRDPQRNNQSGKEICAKMNAGHCIIEKTGFACDCSTQANHYWNDTRCVALPVCLAIDCPGINEVCVEDTDGNAECVCNDQSGYSRDAATKQCRLYDPCSMGKQFQLNKDPNLHCYAAVLGDLEQSDSILYCDEGFVRKFDDEIQRYKCEKLKHCDSTLWNSCEQKCQTDDSNDGFHCECDFGYQLVNRSHCELEHKFDGKNHTCTEPNSYWDPAKEKCTCKFGLNYQNLNGITVCLPKYKQIEYSPCPFQEGIMKNGIPQCQCDSSKGFQLNEQTLTCDLKPVCGQGGEGFRQCADKRALCLLEQTPSKTVGQYRCECPPGHHLMSNGDHQGKICAPHCDDQWIVNECGKRNARCNPLMKWNDQNRTSLNWHDVCLCNQGTSLASNTSEYQCRFDSRRYTVELVVSKLTYKLSNNFSRRFNIDRTIQSMVNGSFVTNFNSLVSELSSTNLLQLVDDYRQSWKRNRQLVNNYTLNHLMPLYALEQIEQSIQSFVGQYIPQNVAGSRVIDCVPQSNQYHRCLVEINSGENELVTNADWTKRLIRTLEQHCHPYTTNSNDNEVDDDDRNCAVILDNSISPLVLSYKSIKSVNVTKYEFCSKYGSHCPANTKCGEVKDSSEYRNASVAFECVCDGGLWLEDSAEISDSIKISTCSVNETYACHQYCPADDSNYIPGVCTVHNNSSNTLVNIRCTCSDDADQTPIYLPTKNPQVMLVNFCLAKSKNDFKILVVAISIVVGACLFFILAFVAVFWIRKVCFHSRSLMDSNRVLELSNMGSYRSNRVMVEPVYDTHYGMYRRNRNVPATSEPNDKTVDKETEIDAEQRVQHLSIAQTSRATIRGGKRVTIDLGPNHTAVNRSNNNSNPPSRPPSPPPTVTIVVNDSKVEQ